LITQIMDAPATTFLDYFDSLGKTNVL